MEADRASEASEEVTCSTGNGWPRGPSGGLEEVTRKGGKEGRREGGKDRQGGFNIIAYEDNILFP